MKHNPSSSSRATPPPVPLDDAPRLVPHAGLPGVDGTTRFCYGFVTEKGAVAAWSRRRQSGSTYAAGADLPPPPEASALAAPKPGAPPNLAAPAAAPAKPGAGAAPTAPGWDEGTGEWLGVGVA